MVEYAPKRFRVSGFHITENKMAQKTIGAAVGACAFAALVVLPLWIW